MNKDIRLNVGFMDHPKTIKLQRHLGHDGVLCLLRLWLFAARHKPTGDLSDMDAEEIAIAAGWANDPSTFVTTLVNVRYIDVDGSLLSLHDWIDHNGYASSSTDRSDKSRFSRMAKTHPAIYTELKGKGYDAISAKEYRNVTNVKRVVNEPSKETLTERLSPLPSPLPSPSIKKKDSGRFAPPTIEEVKAYCDERGNSVDPSRFIDHYTSNGWMVGKNKMKDWKASVRTWEKTERSKTQGEPSKTKQAMMKLMGVVDGNQALDTRNGQEPVVIPHGSEPTWTAIE